MKKILLASTVLAFSFVSPAHAYDNTTVHPGFYAGGFGGYGWTDADTAGEDADVNGGDYGLFVGAELDALTHSLMGLHGAIEAHYAWSDADDTVNIAGSPVNLEKNHEWGISFRPGLAFLDTHSPFGLRPYGILGYRRAEFEASSAALSSSKNYNGFELGIGTELTTYKNYGVRLDYSHVFYGEKDNIDPDENDLRLGVAYHFR